MPTFAIRGPTYRRLVPLIAIAAGLGSLSSVAQGASIAVEGDTLMFSAAPGEANQPKLSIDTLSIFSNGQYVLSEQVPVTPGPGCRPFGDTGAQCDPSGVTQIAIDTGDGNDVVAFGFTKNFGDDPPSNPTVATQVLTGSGDDTMEASDGPSTLVGGPGADTIAGGPADDYIDARDTEVDTVTCGKGTDSVISDGGDSVASDCEQADNGIPPPPAGPVGISINGGDQFTNDPQVSLRVIWPRLATTIYVSNDGGFGEARQSQVATPFSWRLQSSGPERLPKTVYARFRGGDAGPETYQDDIILDQTAPALSQVEVVEGASNQRAKAHTLKLNIKASDQTSGVADMQVTAKKSSPGAWKPYKKTATVKGSKAFVRVRDEAGNPSRWKSAH